MKTQKFLLMALLCLLAGFAFSQNQAPNYFYADPSVFKYRLAEIRNDYFTYYEYVYENNFLVNEIVTDEYGSYVSDIKYYYNSDGYMSKSEEWTLTLTGAPILSKLDEYTRNENGYITYYSRWTLHGEESDPTLTEDVRIDLQYNEQSQLTNAAISFYFDSNNSWIEGRNTIINYDENNLMHEIIQIVSGVEDSRETIEYNESGKITSVYHSSGSGNVEYSYLYDDNSNIYRAGYEDFWFDYEYDTEKLLAETFLPRKTIDELVYFGFLNFTFKGLPYDNSRNVVVKEVLSEAEMIYEDVTTIGLNQYDAVQNDILNLFVSNQTLNINVSDNFIGKDLSIYNIHGICVETVTISTNITLFDMNSHSAGCYIVSIGNEKRKFVKQ